MEKRGIQIDLPKDLNPSRVLGLQSMPTIQEITETLPNLSTEELQHLEHAIHILYRTREKHIIYDDEYGIWTELDQDFAAAEMFRVLEKEEVAADNVNT